MKSNRKLTFGTTRKKISMKRKEQYNDKENRVNIPFENVYTKSDTLKKEPFIIYQKEELTNDYKEEFIIKQDDIKSEILKELQEINLPGQDIYNVFDENIENAIMSEFFSK